MKTGTDIAKTLIDMISGPTMKIDILVDSKHYGGIEAHIGQLAPALRRLGHQVCVIFWENYGDHPLISELDKNRTQYLHLTGSPLQKIACLRARKASVIHTHGYKAGIMGRLAAWQSPTACCSSFHAGEQSHGKLRIYTTLDRWSAIFADQIIAVSRDIARSLPERTLVLKNFVQVNIHQHEGSRIAFVGRLSHEKAPDRIIALAKQLPQRTFHIYGNGPLRPMLEAEASKNVIFHGQCDMSQEWPHIDLLLMPSRAEGLPLAALEAQAHGIPVLATAVGDLPTLITTGSNGWLLAPKAEDFAAAIEHWLHLATWRKSVIRYTCQAKIAQNYSSDVVLDDFIQCYQQAMKKRTGYVFA